MASKLATNGTVAGGTVGIANAGTRSSSEQTSSTMVAEPQNKKRSIISAHTARMTLVYLYLIRFSILLWISIGFLGFLAWIPGLRSLANGVVVLESWQQIIFSTFAAFIACSLALGNARLVSIYGGYVRFEADVPSYFACRKPMRWRVVWASQIPSFVFSTVILINTFADAKHPLWYAVAALAGLTAGLAFVFWVTFFYYLVRPPSLPVHSILLPIDERAFATAPDRPEWPLFLKSPFVAAAKTSNANIKIQAPTFLRWLAEFPGYGYKTTSGSFVLHSGHALVFTFMALAIVAFSMIGLLTRPDGTPGSGTYFPVVLAVIMLLTIIGGMLSILAFWLDRFRIPVLTTVVLLGFPVVEKVAFLIIIAGVLLSVWFIWKSLPKWVVAVVAFAIYGLVFAGPAEHYYEVGPQGLGLEYPAATAEWITPAMVVQRWEEQHPDPSTPMTVVAIEGGGIQASAWAAKVLGQLDVLTHSEIRDSLILMSSVSGGSVAAMDYANQYLLENEKSGRPWTAKANQYSPESSIDCRLELARTSSLEAVAWGLVFADTARTVIPGVANFRPFRYVDRGETLERRWRLLRSEGPQSGCTPFTKQHNLPLSAWSSALAAGHMPAVALNSTGTETGQRFIFSNFVFAPVRTAAGSCDAKDLVDAATLRKQTWTDDDASLSFHEVFPSCDIDVATAVRMSATFPFVAPQARARADGWPLDANPGPRLLHLADGGYYDTYGIFTAIDFLRAGLKVSGPRRKLLFIRILCCEEPSSTAVLNDNNFADHGGWYQTIAPLETMMQVRSAGQWENDSRAVSEFGQLVSDQYDFIPVKIAFSPQAIPSAKPTSWWAKQKQLGQQLAAHIRGEDQTVPLSWHLTEPEKGRIGTHWCDLVSKTPTEVRKVLDAFPHRGTLAVNTGCSADR